MRSLWIDTPSRSSGTRVPEVFDVGWTPTRIINRQKRRRVFNRQKHLRALGQVRGRGGGRVWGRGVFSGELRAISC